MTPEVRALRECNSRKPRSSDLNVVLPEVNYILQSKGLIKPKFRQVSRPQTVSRVNLGVNFVGLDAGVGSAALGGRRRMSFRGTVKTKACCHSYAQMSARRVKKNLFGGGEEIVDNRPGTSENTKPSSRNDLQTPMIIRALRLCI